jgi:hypothetical protein
MPTLARFRGPFVSGCAAVTGAAAVLTLCCWSVATVRAEHSPAVVFPEPIAQQGTIAFEVRTTQAYRTGPDSKDVTVDLLELPGLARCRFEQSTTVCAVEWLWETGVKAEGLTVEIPTLPGPDTYFFLFTWDATAGQFTGYVNGVPLRLPGTQLPPWQSPVATEARLAGDAAAVSFVSAEPRYLDPRQSLERVPEGLRGHRGELFGVFARQPAAIDIESRRGEVLYASKLDTTDSITGWVMEGPGQTHCRDGWMEMASQRPRGPEGHSVHWCPETFPERFVAEWEMQVVSETGLCIVFFAAAGPGGEDVFSPTLPKRTGIFTQYTQGGIDCYHISYFANTPSAPGRITSNIRKNSGFYLIANGPPGIEPGSEEVHRLRLVKDSDHIQLQVDDRVVIDSTDDGQGYGPALGAGKIGLRQMQWTVARYRDFRVHALHARED